ARFLEAIAAEILACGDGLILRAMAETGLPRTRLEGERGRTVGQLRLFAEVLRAGHWVGARIDHADPARTPLPRPDLRLRHIGVGPVAVFGASNFPLAFSVAGGDTASALAAGCPVVAKAHPAHPGTSEIVGRAVRAAAQACGMPEGVFSLVSGQGNEVGAALVADPRIKSVGFTGSRAGGMALVAIAARRAEPIPVHAEMSSVNPVFLFPGALALRAEQIARGFVASLTLGAGQFCTNPGLVFAVGGETLDRFLGAAGAALAAAPAQTMLTAGIHAAYGRGLARLEAAAGVAPFSRGAGAESPQAGEARLYVVDSERFREQPALQEEVFGAAGIVVRCASVAEFAALAAGLEGQLTATLHLEEPDHAAAAALLPLLEAKAGRILCNGFPTGVEVAHAMVHGGPFPATSDARTTSVGSLAIERFLRPVCYQDLPAALLPEAVREHNPLGLWRLVDGTLARA
ncbi:MAG: aldehyde dehydrogenase (NADP(+)), partial [Acetobacteraceae bacterium]